MMLLTRFSFVCCLLGCVALLSLGASPGPSLGQGSLALASAVLGTVGAGIALAVSARHWRTQLARVKVTALHVATLLLCGLLARTTLPLSARVLVSEPWLRPKAEALLGGSRPNDSDSYLIGLFVAHATAENDGIVAFHTGLYGIWNIAGIAFSRSTPPSDRFREYTHLYGPWWRFRSLDD